MIFEGVYPVTRSVIQWLNHTLYPIEAGTFRYWRNLLPLVQVCDDTLKCSNPIERKTKRLIAESAIRQHNRVHGTSLTYEEILGRMDYSIADLGDWAAYCLLEDQRTIIEGDYDEPLEAFRHADPTVKWIVLWLAEDGNIVVFRSPLIERRAEFNDEEFDENVSDGLERGHTPTYVLPPEIEGSIRQDLKE